MGKQDDKEVDFVAILRDEKYMYRLLISYHLLQLLNGSLHRYCLSVTIIPNMW